MVTWDLLAYTMQTNMLNTTGNVGRGVKQRQLDNWKRLVRRLQGYWSESGCSAKLQCAASETITQCLRFD